MRILHNNYRKGIFLAICTSLFMLPACSKGKGGSGGGAQDGDEEIRLNTELTFIPKDSSYANVKIIFNTSGLTTTFTFEVEVGVDTMLGARPWTADLKNGILHFDDPWGPITISDISAKITQLENMGKKGITLQFKGTSSPQTVNIDQLYIEFDSLDDSLNMRTGTIKYVNAATYEGEQMKGDLNLDGATINVKFY